jgi:hypothetical protein
LFRPERALSLHYTLFWGDCKKKGGRECEYPPLHGKTPDWAVCAFQMRKAHLHFTFQIPPAAPSAGIAFSPGEWYNTREKKAEQPFSPCRNGAHGFIVISSIPIGGMVRSLGWLMLSERFFYSYFGGTLLLAQKKC